MAFSQYNVTWNSYTSNICNGFAMLQQKEEFVDMTLVAGGHIVKVHKNIIALASPYIKDMIKSAPCDHPVIFLSNISHEILGYILEYVYTGEVKIETDKMKSFINAATDLHITGITNDLNITNTEPICVPQEKPIHSQDRTTYNEEINKNDLPIIELSPNENILNPTETDSVNSFSDLLQLPEHTNLLVNQDLDGKSSEINLSNVDITPSTVAIDINGSIPQQYTVSKRGSLQLIMNRYMYCMHHQSLGGRKRRWRCIDYRLLHCPAFIDTLNDQVTDRKNIHCHPYHDEKILRNIKKNLVFGSLNIAIQNAGKINEINDGIMDEDD